MAKITKITKSRKAQAEVITTVLLILIGIAAVVLVGYFVMDLVSSNLKGTDCFKTQGQLSIDLNGITYFNSTTKILYVTVQRGSTEFNLTGITLTAGTEGTTKAIVIKAGASGNFSDSGISMYNNGILDQNLVTPGPSERRTYAFDLVKLGIDSASIVSINPMLKGLCEESDKKDIPVLP